jgi:hypothetical protein
MIEYTVRMFAPEYWGEVDRFSAYFRASFPEAKKQERRALTGVDAHFRKALLMQSVALRLLPTLEIDKNQLDTQGFTPAQQAKELSSVIETVILELYAAVDCTRQVVYHRCPVRGLRDSTRATFEAVQSGRLQTLPKELLSAFGEATWFDPLRQLRDSLVHWDIGSVHQDRATGKVRYCHNGLGTAQRALAIEDIFARLDSDIGTVNQFIGQVFRYLRTLLKDEPTQVTCGMHNGRVLIRKLYPDENLTFQSGTCLSVNWIEVDGIPSCPLLCEAYKRAKEQSENQTSLDSTV